jgi:hypothetical protein
MSLSYSSNAGPLMTLAAIICPWRFCFSTPYSVQLIRAARKKSAFRFAARFWGRYRVAAELHALDILAL